MLLVRILLQKRTRFRQPIQWRKHRKMAIQLFAISSPYLFFNLPEMIGSLAKPFGSTSEIAITFELWLNFISYFAEILLPLICLAALHPKPWSRRHRLVNAATITLTNQTRRVKNT
ncbi:unnamed protein product [Rotaria sp. Silwood1]|nr:unnamed protein product [Rotaria sp. Silwood1]CAF3566619.1 unnamed protein product [Rotaria sp. Silwood1]